MTEQQKKELEEFDFDTLFVEPTAEEQAEINAKIETKMAAEAEAEKARIEEKERKKCRKCNGAGIINAYTHIKRGICFTCGGSGTW